MSRRRCRAHFSPLPSMGEGPGERAFFLLERAKSLRTWPYVIISFSSKGWQKQGWGINDEVGIIHHG